jgi:hypothetical protein
MAPRSLGRKLGATAAVRLFAFSAAGDPLEEIRSVAQLPALDLATLKSGQVVTSRGKDGDFARGISLQSCYFIAAPMAAVGEKLLHWNPAGHQQMNVRLYREYPLASPREAFQAVRLASTVANDRWLLDRTLAIADGAAARDLHLTPAETQIIHDGVPKKGVGSAQAREARANGAWGEILRRRSESLARGGIAAVAPYGNDNAISPGSEFRGLLSLDSKVAKYFRPLLSARPLTAGGASDVDESVGYWETSIVRGHSTLQLGVFAARKSAANWQLLDCVYYPSDTYFMALDLFQLWPLDKGTLLWQTGFVSAPFRSYLGGVDRFVAGKQMTQETLETIKAFREDIEKAR